jgi:decaprenyl-phosphate phosphoribosyltransferase
MTDVAPRARPARSLPVALLVAARPKQWVKNLLVFVAPAAAGVLDHRAQLGAAMVAFVAFCAASSGTYLLNDVADVEADRRHPVKRFRPIAAGEVGVSLARVVGATLLVASMLVAVSVDLQLLAVVAGYVALTTCYSTWLKHVPVLDMAAVAAGFLLRAAAGAAATDVPISSWFYIVATAGSFFVVAAKRLAELRGGGADAADTRAILAHYSVTYLGYLLAVSSGIAIMGYCLWSFEQAALHAEGAAWLQLSAIPFVLGLLRYALLVDAGGGGEPEEIVLGDRLLQVIGVCWAAVFLVGIYVG